MDPNVGLPLATSSLSLVFAILLIRRFAHRRAPYLCVWAVGLVWYAISAATEALGGAFGWSPALYRWWYLTGAIGVAAYLGAGSAYLHHEAVFAWLVIAALVLGCIPPLASGYVLEGSLGVLAALVLAVVALRHPAVFGHTLLGILVLATVLAAARIATAAVDTALLPTSSSQVVTGQAFGPDVRILTPPFNIPGAGALLIGAALSAVRYWRGHGLPRRVVSNVLIAAGAFVPSVTSGLARFGLSSAFLLGQLLGVACILAGFMLSGSPTYAVERRPGRSKVAG